MAARLCRKCGAPWPHHDRYTRCPLCRITTAYKGQVSPLSEREIFERRYAKYDQERSGPTPEDVGAFEAKRDYGDVIQGMHRTVRAIRELPEID